MDRTGLARMHWLASSQRHPARCGVGLGYVVAPLVSCGKSLCGKRLVYNFGRGAGISMRHGQGQFHPHR